MGGCVVVASTASRKAVAIAKSISEILNLDVVGVAHKVHPNVFSIYFKRRYIVEANRWSPTWVRGVLSIALSSRCLAVVPVDYVDIYMFSMYKNLFEDNNIVVVAPSHNMVRIASSRVEVYKLLKDIALFPRQVYISSSRIDEVYGLSPPIVVKDIGDTSNPSFHLDHEQAINEALRRIPCVVQEYVEGIARGYYALAVEGKPMLEFTHQRIVEYMPIGGASLAASGYLEDPVLIDLGRRIIERLSWTGVVMVETRYVDELGKYFVIEVNPKFWGSIDLPVLLGFHFPALALSLHLYGVEKVEEIVLRLKMRKGFFSWVLDGFRYVARSPCIWLRLAGMALRYPRNSDVDPIDGARVLMQIIYALRRFGRERREWVNYLLQGGRQLNVWARRFVDVLTHHRKALVLDLDGTLVDLDIDWGRVRERLYKDGYVHRWESINRALSRLWLEDRGMFYEVSKMLEEVELKALDRSKLLIDSGALEGLCREFTICVATKQSAKVAQELLKQFYLRNYVDHVVARDSGVYPLKKNLYKLCLDIIGGAKALVLDDNIQYIIDAYRLGLAPIHISRNIYIKLRAQRLGIPSTSTKKALKIIRSAVNLVKSSQ